MMSQVNSVSIHANAVRTLLQSYNDSPHQICVNGENLRISDIHRVFKGKLRSVSLTEENREVMKKGSSFLNEKSAEGCCVYGVNTGFGGSADVRHEKDEEVQTKLVIHLNVGFGRKLPIEFVKAAMLVRVNCLIRGYSGVSPQVVELLAELINHDIVPYVPMRGSISASGDLIPTSYIAACLEGNQDCKVRSKGKDTVASLALAQANLSPVVFKGKDALGVVNASSFAATLAADVLYNGNRAILLAQAVVAMAVEALQGTMESFDPIVHEICLPHTGQREVARNIRMFLEGTHFTTTHDCSETPGLRQDRYGLRTSPQFLGPGLETAMESIRRVEIELNSACDNPIVDPRTKQIIHCGNFQGTSTTVAMDQFRQSIQLCGKLLFALMSEIVDCTINNGLTPNLCGGNPNVDMGFKGTEIAMASYTSELDYLTNPVTNHVLSAELRNQSVNSLALISARLSETALELFQMQLTNILCALCQAIELRWLKNNVEMAISEILAKAGCLTVDKSILLKVIPWYNFVHQPNESVTNFFKNFSNKNSALFDGSIESQIRIKIENMMDTLRSGSVVQTISKEMGFGKFSY